MISRANLIRIGILGALIGLVLFTSFENKRQDGLLKVYFFDVGQGDAIFIQAPNGRQVLVDGGPNNTVLQNLSKAMSPKDRNIDVVLLSHPHADHVSGLVDVLDRYQINYIVQAKENYDSSEFRAWQDAVSRENAIEIEAIAGKVFDLGMGARLTILHPANSAAGITTDDPHKHMVVVQLEYGDAKILLTGDMEADVERFLASRINIRADVLKVGHHGSKTSTSELFLNAVNPQAAVIQLGDKNRYGHPSKIVLDRLESLGIPYYRTDLQDNIELQTDGSTIAITVKN
ncbi:MAG: ComEC/Rec2 family competence protein [Candidatus Yanofskybacteria bacterium]|nr:ComEC/Rec2 family competence protein [Candidatus Yanofskybacteria bacterium]